MDEIEKHVIQSYNKRMARFQTLFKEKQNYLQLMFFLILFVISNSFFT